MKLIKRSEKLAVFEDFTVWCVWCAGGIKEGADRSELEKAPGKAKAGSLVRGWEEVVSRHNHSQDDGK